MDRPTFSPFWHRVRSMKPRLRPHVQITRQHYRGRRWHVVHDPTNNQFYRLSPIAYDFVSLLDGTRGVEESWKISLAKFGDMAPTQNEIIELLGQLYNSNLLSIDAPPETEQLLGRGRERAQKRALQQAVGLMYLKLRLFNPTPILNFVEPLLRPLLNKWGFFAWLAFIITMLVNLAPHWRELAGGLDSITSPSNWGWMLLTFVLLKLWHETGHGVICHRFGGQVPEFGVMLLVLIPSPFVDASSCWAFPSKWQRIAVGAGGMIFELFAAAVAAIVWLNTPEGSFERQIAYYIMLTSGVSTVLFNANPLMRFDGYYILSDLLEVPNLMTRSANMLKYLFQRYVYGLKQARSPSTQRGEQIILIVYGVLSLAYRVLLFVGITLYVLGLFFFVGLFLAVWTAAMWFVLPTGKFIHWLSTSSQLIDHRARAIATTLAMIAGGAMLVGMLPLPDYRRATGVVESPFASGVYQGTDGFVAEAYVQTGDHVKKDDPIVLLSSPDLQAEHDFAVAAISEMEGRLAEAIAKEDTAGAAAARRSLVSLHDQWTDVKRRLGELVVRSPHDGTIVLNDPHLLVGSYGKQGRAICMVADTAHRRIAITVSQTDADWLFDLPRDQYEVQMRLVSRPSDVVTGHAVRPVQAAQRRLPHAALSFAGGGAIQTNQQDPTGRTATTEQFPVYVEIEEGTLGEAALGQRVYLRFALPHKSLMTQAIERLERAIQGKVNL